MSDSEDNTAAIAENTTAIEENTIDILDNTARINVLDELRGRNYMQNGSALIALPDYGDVFLFNNGGSIRIKDDPKPHEDIGSVEMRKGQTTLTIFHDGQFEFRNTQDVPRSGNYDINLHNGNDEGAFILSNHDSNITIVEEGDIQLNSNRDIELLSNNASITVADNGNINMSNDGGAFFLNEFGNVGFYANGDASLTSDNQVQLGVGQNSVTVENGSLTIRDETGSATLTAEQINRLKETLT